MRELSATVAGLERPIWVADDVDDLDVVVQAICGVCDNTPIAVDTETTGLDIYGDGYAVRVVQFGTTQQAWVIPIVSRQAEYTVRMLLWRIPELVAHNASFDIRSLGVTGLCHPSCDLWSKTYDTYLMAHLLDPREKLDGGSGHSLEELSVHYFDADAVQYKTALFDRFKELGFKRDKELGWGPAYAAVPIGDEGYLRYAGVDVLLASWLFSALRPLIVSRDFPDLLEYEHRLSRICGGMMTRGMLIDTEYMEALGPSLSEEAEANRKLARRYGVENVNSTAQVAEALLALGAPLESKTKTGKWKVDKEVLEGLEGDDPWSPLASAVMAAKNLEGFRTKYVTKVLDNLDANGRIHADVRSLKARTARMAVANPPLQQLPSGDWKIRRGFRAEEGHVIVAADLDQVELRVLAALAKERTMLDAIRNGQDLHQVTADGAKTSRKVGKMANFLMVYGGGAGKLARSAGIPKAEAQKVVSGYHRTFPGVKRFSRKIMDRAEMGQRWVTTPTGRELPMDRDRIYAGLNYLIQSTARDVLGQALINMEDAGVIEYVVMVVHDEVIAEVPVEKAEEVARILGECMTFRDFLGSGIDLTASGEVYGPTWGHGYGAAE